MGCEGNDQLTGGYSGDLLIGGEGADRIIGGASNDVMVGGELLDAANNEDDQYNDLVSVLNAGLIISLNLAVDVVQVWLNPKLKFE